MAFGALATRSSRHITNFSAIAAISFFAGLSSAQSQSITRTRDHEVVDSYTAYIGANDVYNSAGVRLTKPWQIIRQDRANYHAYDLRDVGDEADSFFSDPGNRQTLEVMLENGSMSPSARAKIVQGDCWVNVKVLGKGERGTFLVVDVF